MSGGTYTCWLTEQVASQGTTSRLRFPGGEGARFWTVSKRFLSTTKVVRDATISRGHCRNQIALRERLLL